MLEFTEFFLLGLFSSTVSIIVKIITKKGKKKISMWFGSWWKLLLNDLHDLQTLRWFKTT